MTQMLVSSFAGVPGFVSDPVFDTSRNEVIHAHCVSATRMKGPHAPASPYLIRNHLETNEGAVVQVLMPVGEPITVARFADPARLLITTAEVTGTEGADRGCRSQIRTRVANAERWLQKLLRRPPPGHLLRRPPRRHPAHGPPCSASRSPTKCPPSDPAPPRGIGLPAGPAKTRLQ